MKEEIQKTFDDYLQRLKQDESICENFKKLVLEQLGLGTELDPILFRFLEIAKEQKYPYAVPLGYAMLFYATYSKNIDLAITYNEKARAVYENAGLQGARRYPDGCQQCCSGQYSKGGLRSRLSGNRRRHAHSGKGRTHFLLFSLSE